MKKYKYNNKQYNSFWQLQNDLSNIGFPPDVTDEQLKEFGIEVIITETPLEELKLRKLAEVNFWTESKIVGGFFSSVTGIKVKYDSDKDTQLTMQGIALNVKTPLFDEKYPTGCPVRGVKEGEQYKSIQMLTADQVLAWCADLSMHIGTCKQKGWEKQNEVAKAKNKKELDAIILD